MRSGSGPSGPRWTHIALRVRDIDETVDFYTSFTPLELLDRRRDDDGFAAWLGQPSFPPFVLVVAQFLPDRDPYGDAPQEVLAPFAHLGIELPSLADLHDVAARAEEAGRLAMPVTELPAPIGTICMVRDPDGNMVEFSYDQGVYAKAREVWG